MSFTSPNPSLNALMNFFASFFESHPFMTKFRVLVLFANKSFMQPMGRLSMHSWTIQFFVFFCLQGPGRGIFCVFPWFSMILMMFRQEFPNVFPRMFPIAPGFYPIWFAQSSHGYKLTRWNLGECICFYFATGIQRGACAMFQKICWWAINMTP
jgi:hypothetical protein